MPELGVFWCKKKLLGCLLDTFAVEDKPWGVQIIGHFMWQREGESVFVVYCAVDDNSF